MSSGGIFDKNWVPLHPLAEPFTPPARPVGEDYGFQPFWASDPITQNAPDQPTPTFAAPIHLKPLFGPAPETNPSDLKPAQKSTLTAPTKDQISSVLKAGSIITDFSTFDYAAMGLVAGIWMGADLVYKGIKSTLHYAGYVAAGAITGGRRLARGGRITKMRSRRTPRHDPLSRAKRQRTPRKDGKGQSMLDLPPHYVGATPHRMRNERGLPKKKAIISVPSPLETPQPKKRAPKLAETAKKVRFAEDGPNTPKGTTSLYGALDTPALIRETPAALRKPLNVREEFKKNFKKTEFSPWVDFLHSQGIKMRVFRTELQENLSLPTDAILKIYDDRENNPKNWDTLVLALSHNGFLERMRIVVPKYRYGPPPINWQEVREKNPVKINWESPYQQQDGCCRFCRGFSWAGKVETREIARFGDEVQSKPQHKSVVPYTEREKEEFANNVFDSFWRRCCQESRWDWLFEEPQITGASPETWKIPKSDPRLRHFRRFKGPKGNAHGGLTLADNDLLKELETLRDSLSRQDIAAKLFIDAVFKSGNHELAQDLTKADKERKRRQVHTEMLCVRQVRLLVGGSPTRYNKQQDLVESMSSKGQKLRFSSGASGEDEDLASANDSPSKVASNGTRKPLGLKRHTNGSKKTSAANWGRSKRSVSPDKSTAPFNPNDLKKWKREPEVLDEWARFQEYQARKKESRMHLEGLNTFGSDPNAGLDPEEIAEREYELGQQLWAEFQKELGYLKEEAKIDEKTKAEKEAQAKVEAAVKIKTDEERSKKSDTINQKAYGKTMPAGMNFPHSAVSPINWAEVVNIELQRFAIKSIAKNSEKHMMASARQKCSLQPLR
ncbi:hypothetical protein L873DRAFT_1785167 [Choiromyces venosus 120613-1]|uniref:Uncharacterized protein n=1 Tax=Choiromyces venosus 120613-1 TaxID=1336337 RepID=A0A3N4K9K6_9PEZI|nr:hypothetical protein L873DRAFT_1785167 [Choiromyces venosus 120613-1]